MSTYRRVESPEGAGVEGLALVERTLPRPNPGECVVRVEAASINRSDIHRIRGEYGGVPMFRFSRYSADPSSGGTDEADSAYVPGMEAVGVVLSVGSHTDKALVGCHVLVHSHSSCGACDPCCRGFDNACEHARIFGSQTPGMGAWSEQVLVPVSQVMILPDGLRAADVVGVEVTYGPVWWGLCDLAALTVDDVVAIQGGASNLGVAALEIARGVGATVVSIVRDSSSPRSRGLADLPGAVVVDRSGASPEWFKARFGRRPRVVLDLVGAATFRQSLDIVAAVGTILDIGAHTGVEVPLRLDEAFSRSIAIQGVGRAPISVMAKLVREVGAGSLHPMIAREFALKDVVEAIQYADEPDRLGRVLLVPDRAALSDGRQA